MAEAEQGLQKLIAALVQELPSILGLLFFFGGAYLAYFTFIWTDSPFVRLLFLALLLCITLVRVIRIISRMVFSPTSLAFRIVPLHCSTASTMHRLILWSSGYMVVAMMFTAVSNRLGAQPATLTILQLFFATLLLTITAIAIVLMKKQIADQIIAASGGYGESVSWGRRRFAAIWHVPALIYLLCMWLLLFNDLLHPDHRHRGAFLLSFFVVPIWVIADRLLQWLIKYTMATLKIHGDEMMVDDAELSDDELIRRQKGYEMSQRVLTVGRSGLVISLLIWVASLWDLTVPFVSHMTAALLDTLLILTVALVFWKFVSSWIERKIAEATPEVDENQNEQDDEWGAAATRGRSYTLLPMVRRFIATILVTLVTMTILSALGVNIGPLLAGAGVVGLAVGFGAQKLVADMFSGFFYLLDDAFRVGEYVTAGSISGTVENISLRNVMLRHHRGMLQIVPHSDLGAITNFMRGGIIVKFNLDFPYDADIDKIRKIIKKVGQAMLTDEEFGEDFIRPVKSQGVREISNSVMTIRVKFTAQPGAHFLIRREAYRRITEALRTKGIDYAHKKVIVDIGEDAKNDDPAETARRQTKAAGAAAGSSLLDENQNNKNTSGSDLPFES